MRILLLLVVAGVAIGIAGALFSGGESAARDPVVTGTAPSPSGGAPETGEPPAPEANAVQPPEPEAALDPPPPATSAVEPPAAERTSEEPPAAGPAAAEIPASDDATELIELLRPLVAEPDPDVPNYDRDHFAGWLDSDGDCVNTRHEILQAEAVDYSMNAAECAVDSGEWFDPYTNRTFTNPRDLDVDHVVALADAWVSGAWAWADELLDNFSNDFGNLNAIAAGENRSKSARGPAGYSPTAAGARCQYLVQYATVKINWRLSITPEDFGVVAAGLSDCEVGNIPDASPVTQVTPPAAPDASAAESPTTTSTTHAATDCHPAYEPCLPNLPGDALNCGDLRADQKPVTVMQPGTDPYRLDRDGSGRGCTG